MTYSTIKLFSTPKSTTAYNLTPMLKQQITNAQTINWQEKIDNFTLKCTKEASLNILKGTASIKFTYIDSDIDAKDKQMSFLKKKFSEWQSREMIVNSTYKFGYDYDLTYFNVNDLGNGDISIILYPNALRLTYTEEVKSDTTMETDKGFLAKKFNNNEVLAISNRVQIHVQNTLNRNTKLRDMAMNNTEEVLKELAQEFGFNNVSFERKQDFVIDSTEVNVLNLNIDAVNN
jgi:hypothetical protein